MTIIEYMRQGLYSATHLYRIAEKGRRDRWARELAEYRSAIMRLEMAAQKPSGLDR